MCQVIFQWRISLHLTNFDCITAVACCRACATTVNLVIVEKTSHAPDLVDKESTSSRRGRPQVTLNLSAQAATTVVVSLLLNRLEVTLYDYVGQMLHQSRITLITSELSGKLLSKNLVALLDKALDENPVYRTSLKHIAVVYQGIVSSDNKRMLWSPITDVRDFDLAAFLQSSYGVGVTVLNDCKTMASALYQEHQLKNENTTADNENFAVILLSYGIGLGLFHQGTILTGSHSSGTEFGHMLLQPEGALCRCGRNGCIEAYASDYAIWRNAMGHSRA